MVNLTIRNLTTTPLELRRIERFRGEPVPGEGIKKVITSRITSIFNSNNASSPANVRGVNLKPGTTGWVRAQEFYEGAIYVPLPPFETRATNIRAVDPAGTEVARVFFNPREVLIMSLKREGTGKGTDGDLSRYLSDRYCGRDDARRWFTDSRIPTLGEVRGRIVLVRRFWIDDSLKGHNDGRGFAIDGEHWPDNCDDGTVGSGLIRVQDFYEMDQSTNIEKKTELARAQLERACEQRGHYHGMPNAPEQLPGPNPLFVNFLTASNFFSAGCWPEKIAAKVNPAIIEYLCMRHGDHGKGPNQLAVGDSATGIVVTDWVGQDGDWDLIRAIVGWNARLQLLK
ncbi:1-phosphatidylinositol phosphodiesterase [Magnaporthiopsis poae ATCC 64411]|uniref:1-phosphatidylinositol phosphodiesterase n=1 Tax=Magnaporthiopsis poae (strain ATCC 64411 / 73-15) TaxID=644358 RepID=A0A0C4E253_MAGP6|nr:1-phosphatidylinositol phosphodiesterase [Magnaporthiopsis poae ATCC 64411]